MAMWTIRPSSRPPTLKLPSIGAPRQMVWAMRLTGVQKPAPVAASATIDYMAITTPPGNPARASTRALAAFMASSSSTAPWSKRNVRNILAWPTPITAWTVLRGRCGHESEMETGKDCPDADTAVRPAGAMGVG